MDALMYHLWTLSSTYVFILEDFEFFTEDKYQLLFLVNIDLLRFVFKSPSGSASRKMT